MREYASKRKIVILIGVVFTLIIGVLIKVNIPKQDLNKETNQSTNSNRTLAVYIEEDGEYKASSSGDFPTDGYILDTEKSTCENGGELSQDQDTKQISLSVDHKTKCSLYFKKEIIPEPLVPKLLSQANDESITDYNSGNKKEMFIFKHNNLTSTSTSRDNNYIYTNTATQVIDWTEEERKDYRYIGSTPNNYVTFNNEPWRIIGVFTVEGENGEKEQRIKIIRDESIGDFSWDMKEDGTKTNEWPTSSSSIMLNGNYLNQEEKFNFKWYRYNYATNTTSANTSVIQGLNYIARNQIAATKWYLGGYQGTNTNKINANDYYNFERGTTTYATNHSGETRSTSWVAKVGLMYPSDYVYTYANGVDNTCFQDGYNCATSRSGTPSAGWLFISHNYQSTISPSTGKENAFYIGDTGFVDMSGVGNSHINRPCVYLRSDIEIISGTGAENDPYILKS